MRISDWSSDVCSSDLLLHQIVKRVFFTLPVEFGAELGERAQVDWTRAKQHIDFFDKARIGTGDIAVPEFVIDRSGRKSALNHQRPDPIKDRIVVSHSCVAPTNSPMRRTVSRACMALF